MNHDCCENCAAAFVIDPGRETEMWQCRRRPPEPSAMRHDNWGYVSAMWPMVAKSDWCYEHVQKAPREKRAEWLYEEGDDGK